MHSDEIRAELERKKAALAPLQAEVGALQRQLRDALSREFIAANRIRRADVQMSSGPGVPYFGHIKVYIEWLRSTRCAKRYAEWNMWLYPVAELLDMRMDPDAPGLAEHVPD